MADAAEAPKEFDEARMKDLMADPRMKELSAELEKNMAEGKAAEAPGGFVGIDLGVSCVVASSAQDTPDAITVNTNDVSGTTTPSAVSFEGKQRHVGVSAEGRVMSAPKQTWTHLPLTLGDEETVAKRAEKFLWLFGREGGKLGPVTFDDDSISCSPCGPLGVLMRTCASYAGSAAPKELCFAVHDYLSDQDVAGLRDAVSIAGFSGATLLRHSDAVVAAWVHTAGKKLLPEGTTERTIAFADVGLSHGTVSVVKFSAKEDGALNAEYLFRRCNEDLGVQSFITALVKEAASRIEAKHKCKVNLKGKPGQRLSVEAVHCMKQLSMLPDGNFRLEAFMPEGPDGPDIDVDLAFTRDAFEASVSEVLEAFKAMLDEALATAPDGVEGVELIGGGSRIPAVKKLLSDAVGEEKLRFGLDGASGVARGAAAWAAGHRLLPAIPDGAGALSAEALAEVLASEASIQAVNASEVARLEQRNALESYVYQVRGDLNGADGSLMNPAEVGPYLDSVTLWFEDREYADEPTSLEAYTEKFLQTQAFVKEKGAAYFEKKAQRKEDQEKAMEKATEEERARRKELGMDFDKDDRHMKKEDRLRLAGKNKDEGNDMFKAQKFDDAIRRYKKAIEHVSRPEAMSNFTPDEAEEARKIKVSCHLNSAQCYIKGAEAAHEQGGKNAAEPYYKKAKTSCDDVLSLDEASIKGLFRRALCNEKCSDIDAAMKDVKSGLKLDENNADLVKSKTRLDKIVARQKEQSKKMAQKMFG